MENERKKSYLEKQMTYKIKNKRLNPPNFPGFLGYKISMVKAIKHENKILTMYQNFAMEEKCSQR